MGCGSSTMAHENADIQAKVRPMMKRRIDHLKRRRNLMRESTLSKKELLGVEDCDKTSTNNDSSEGSTDRGAAKIYPVAEEVEEEAKINVEEVDEKEKKIATKQENGGENESDEMEEEEVENDEDEGRRISPGSPSFRVYCLKSVPQDSEDDHESHNNSPKKNVDTKMIDEHSRAAESAKKDSATRNPNRKTSNKFRWVINKGGHVKSLLNVKSCYNSGSSPNEKAHALLLPQAVA